MLADELATEFKEKGYPSYVIEVRNPTPSLTGTYYRVRIGGFSTSVDAKAFAENILVPAHFEYWVDRKANESAARSNRSLTGVLRHPEHQLRRRKDLQHQSTRRRPLRMNPPLFPDRGPYPPLRSRHRRLRQRADGMTAPRSGD